MTWRTAQIRGSVGATWRVTRISGTIAPPKSDWLVARVSGSVSAGWRVANIRGAVTNATVPIVGAFTPVNVDPISLFQIVAGTTNGVVPDSYTFHVGTTGSGSSDLDSRIISVVGNTALISPPGSTNGSTITVTVIATLNSFPSAAVAVALPVRKGSVFQVAAGALKTAAPPVQPPYTYTQVLSAGTAPTVTPNLISTAIPVINGARTVGSVGTVSNGSWVSAPDSYTYQWYRNGTPIGGATASTYTYVQADNGTQITASVGAKKAGYIPGSATSAAVTISLPNGGVLSNTTAPRITGTAAVGQTLTVSSGTWTPTPDSYTYAWLSNGTQIATGTTYTVASGDQGNTLSAQVTAVKASYSNVTVASSNTLTIPAVVTGGAGGFTTAFGVGKTASGAISMTGQSGFTISGKYFQNIGNDVSSIRLTNCTNFVVEQNDFESVCQPLTLTGCSNYTIRYNRAHNITGPHTRNGTNRGNFIQCVSCVGPGQYIGYNKIRDGDTEDVISIYRCNGTSGSPIIVEYNQIENETYTSSSGTGIITGDGGGTYQEVRFNTLLNPGQVGIACAGGSNISLHDNKIWGDQTATANIGMYVADYSSTSGGMHDVSVANNTVFFKNKSGTVNGFYSDGKTTNLTNTGNSFSSQGSLVRANMVVTL